MLVPSPSWRNIDYCIDSKWIQKGAFHTVIPEIERRVQTPRVLRDEREQSIEANKVDRIRIAALRGDAGRATAPNLAELSILTGVGRDPVEPRVPNLLRHDRQEVPAEISVSTCFPMFVPSLSWEIFGLSNGGKRRFRTVPSPPLRRSRRSSTRRRSHPGMKTILVQQHFFLLCQSGVFLDEIQLTFLTAGETRKRRPRVPSIELFLTGFPARSDASVALKRAALGPELSRFQEQ